MCTPACFTHKILHGPANGWPSFHAHLTALPKICHTIKPLEFERPAQAFHITKSYHPLPDCSSKVTTLVKLSRQPFALTYSRMFLLFTAL